jgi:tRNA (guanine10-N2)-dimethyltransferase
MLNLAKEEVLSLIDTNKSLSTNNILITEIKNKNLIKKLAKSLAYTKSIYKLLFESSYNDFLKNMENFDWGSVYKDNFCIRVNEISTKIQNPIKNKNFKTINKNSISPYSIKKNIINRNLSKNKKIINKNKKNNEKLKEKYSERNLAFYVWKKIKNPIVNLSNPKTHIEIFFLEDKVLCCLLLQKLKHNFEERKSHLRPRPTPISLHPKLARAMVNLTKTTENDTILDPFCGSGGILIEAGLMGMKTIGYDINKKMIWKSMVNLKHYKMKDYKLGVKDFFEIKKKYKFIISDLPYGLNTNIMKNIRVTKYNKAQLKQYLKKFYYKIIKKLEKILIKRAVIIFPSYINYKKLMKYSKLKLKNEFESYVHKNLTRKIVVLER